MLYYNTRQNNENSYERLNDRNYEYENIRKNKEQLSGQPHCQSVKKYQARHHGWGLNTAMRWSGHHCSGNEEEMHAKGIPST